MKSTFVIFLVFCCLIISCNDLNDILGRSNSLLYLEVKDGSHTYEGIDSWFVVTDENGQLLDYCHIGGDGNYRLKSEYEGHRINVAEININHIAAPKLYSVWVDNYTGIFAGSRWVLSPKFETTPNPNSEVQLAIENLPDATGRTIQLSSRGGVFDQIWPGDDRDSAFFDLYVSDADRDFMITVSTPNSPGFFYKTDEISALNGKIDFLSAFHVMDVNFSIGLPPSNFGYELAVWGCYGPKRPFGYRKGNLLTYYYSESKGDNLNVGYLNGYDFYKTRYHVRYPNQESATYTKVGSKPSAGNFVLPKYDVTIESSEFGNFQYTISASFDYYTARWQKTHHEAGSQYDFYTWNHSSVERSDQLNNIQLPEELLLKYPFLEKISTVELFSVLFTKRLDGEDYSDWISEKFKDGISSQGEEWIGVTKRVNR